MYRLRDFYGKILKNEKGEVLGKLQDILININDYKVSGVLVKSKGIINTNFYVLKEDILYLGDHVIIKNHFKENKRNYKNLFDFQSIKGLEIIDLKGEVLGLLEDVLFSENLKIFALILSEGFFKNYTKGKRIILIKDIILGEEEILFYNKKPCYFYSKIHGLKNEGECHEKGI